MAINFSALKILIAEDIKPVRDLLVHTLDTLGITNVLLAENGQQAFDLFKKEQPDIVIADWHMDPVDGLELTRKIRKECKSPAREVPIVLITGYGSQIIIDEARDAGVTEYIVKPFSADDLYKRLSYILRKPRDFIDIDSYCGPDRRRRNDPFYKGPYRREDDEENTGKTKKTSG